MKTSLFICHFVKCEKVMIMNILGGNNESLFWRSKGENFCIFGFSMIGCFYIEKKAVMEELAHSSIDYFHIEAYKGICTFQEK